MKEVSYMNTLLKHRPLQLFATLALIVGLAAVLMSFLQWNGFWEDEIFQVAFLNERLPYFFVEIARLDQHPPFHFLQLKFWALFFNSDKGLLLNSIAWHLVSCLVIFWVGRQWLGTTAALLAVALFALTPQVASAAVNLRMYAMIPALAVGTWWLNQRALLDPDKRNWPWFAVLFVQLALGYSHAIAIYFVAWIALAAAVQVYSEHGGSASWKQWLTAQLGSAVLLLPLVASVVIRIGMPAQGEPGGNSDAGSVVTHLGGMVAGWGMKWEYGKPFGFALFALAVLLGMWNRRTRWVALCLLTGPYLAATLIGLFFVPMFKTPVYSAMLMPFACLALAGGLQMLRPVLGTWVGIGLLAVMVLTVMPATNHLQERSSPYKPIAIELEKRAQTGDVVVIPKPYLYWAVLRYAVAPNWGSPLEVLPPLGENWQRLMARLGPELTSALKLQPRTNQVIDRGITYVIGEDAVSASSKATRVWEVRRTRYPTPAILADGFIARGVVTEFGYPETTQLLMFERRN
ncbi:glycosyltransferase family 39 protein [Rhodoferax sp. U11-2br]|uniref:glycosyltransferase family 39 protein n=1 Tax=Rhodoferax sp. U11-2br TaxID=2838878 RepID=UPI001BE4FF2E|nr:glycosyltransferase family 39 protein [Rhodoferax sp. U11-2br]MBT3067046.1 glycosyltransferase family 39 protein [Rhodoferax sp. U11-2br]